MKQTTVEQDSLVVGINICTSPYVCLSIRPYVPCAQLLLHRFYGKQSLTVRQV